MNEVLYTRWEWKLQEILLKLCYLSSKIAFEISHQSFLVWPFIVSSVTSKATYAQVRAEDTDAVVYA